jgi:hypothetical protein
MEIDLQSLLGSMCINGGGPATPPPAFGLIYEGAFGQSRLTTSLCYPLTTKNEKPHVRTFFFSINLDPATNPTQYTC